LISGIADLCFAEVTATPSFRVKLSKSSCFIGEKIRYELIVYPPKNTEVQFPDLAKEMSNFTIDSSGTSAGGFFNKRKTEWIILQSFATGKAVIPKVKLNYRLPGQQDWSSIDVPEQEIEVKSLLDAGGQEVPLRDIKPPVPVSGNSISILILIIILLFAAVAFLFSRRKKIFSAPDKPPKSAHEIAYEQLDELKGRNLPGQGKIKEYYSEVSDIVRHYLENRFALNAPDETTEEFLIHVRDYSTLKQVHKLMLKDFLSCCDLVKFAKFLPENKEMNAVFDAAVKFVDETKKIDEPS
jgi:hypothetical protein